MNFDYQFVQSNHRHPDSATLLNRFSRHYIATNSTAVAHFHSEQFLFFGVAMLEVCPRTRFEI